MKTISHIFFLVALSALFIGCGQREHQFRIGLSQCSDDAWRTRMNEEMQRELLFHPYMTLSIRSANADSRKQSEDIDKFIAEHVDLLVVSPNEADGLTEAVGRAYDAGIPVIVADRRINGDKYTAFIGGDNLQVGRLLADYILHSLPEGGRVLEVQGLSGSTPAVLRHKGMMDGLHDANIRIVSCCGEWFQDKAEAEVAAILVNDTAFDLIVAQNDLMGIGAFLAAEKLLPGNHIGIIGVDALSGKSNGLEAILAGQLDASISYVTAGDLIIQTAADILTGGQIPFRRDTVMPAMLIDAPRAETLVQFYERMDHEVNTVKMLDEREHTLDEAFRRQRRLLMVIAVFAVLLLILFVYYLRLYRQRRRLHEQLMETQGRLEEATRSKLMFFTNVSHDFRTPLTLIADPLGQLERDVTLSQEQHGLVAMAHRNAQVLLRLINQVLDFRKYESGMLRPNWSKVNISQALREWTEAFSPLAKKRHVALSFEAPAETIEAVLDVEKTERIAFNIIANAFKFTPGNGHVGVRLWRKGGDVCFSVSDTGSGIPEAYRQQVFDTFFQLDATNSQGSGIGLALVKSFVTLQGGTITVADNPEGQGTIFLVKLPIGNLSSFRSEPAALAPDQYVHITAEQILTELGTEGLEEVSVSENDDKSIMLVIDDNADIRAYLRQVFCDTYTVITAENGTTGLRKAFISVPDIILCDLSMPDIDGLEVCRQLKTEQVTSHIPVLMLTARSLDEQQIEGYEYGADAYVSKPFKADILKAQVASLIENRKRVKSDKSRIESQKPKVELQTPEEQFVQRFTDLVKERLDDETLSVETLADKMAMSRTQLYRKIKQLTNYSPNEIIRNIRLQEARALLSKGTMAVSEVAYNTGFTSPSYFTKCYTDYFGELPSARNNTKK